MSTTPSTPSTGKTSSTATTSRLQKTGLIVELSGLASFAIGSVLSLTLHHYAIGVLCIGGAAALIVGWKLRKS